MMAMQAPLASWCCAAPRGGTMGIPGEMPDRVAVTAAALAGTLPCQELG